MAGKSILIFVFLFTAFNGQTFRCCLHTYLVAENEQRRSVDSCGMLSVALPLFDYHS